MNYLADSQVVYDQNSADATEVLLYKETKIFMTLVSSYFLLHLHGYHSTTTFKTQRHATIPSTVTHHQQAISLPPPPNRVSAETAWTSSLFHSLSPPWLKPINPLYSFFSL